MYIVERMFAPENLRCDWKATRANHQSIGNHAKACTHTITNRNTCALMHDSENGILSYTSMCTWWVPKILTLIKFSWLKACSHYTHNAHLIQINAHCVRSHWKWIEPRWIEPNWFRTGLISNHLDRWFECGSKLLAPRGRGSPANMIWNISPTTI